MDAAEIDSLIEHFVTSEEMINRKPTSLQKQSVLSAAVTRQRQSPARWTTAEDDYLRNHLGYETDDQMAAALGRTAVAVHLRWERDLNLPAPSKHPDFLTGQQAAQLAGLDQHQVVHWCDVGLIPHRLMAGSRKMRLIRRVTFFRWIVNPENWIYFDWRKIPDEHLKRLCALKAARWGDQWWTARQVADFHGVDTKDVQRLAKRGELPARHAETSLCGRHKEPAWLNWFFKRTDALAVRFLKGRGAGHDFVFSKRAEEWMLEAKRRGFTWQQISDSMGNPCHKHTVRKRIRELTGLE